MSPQPMLWYLIKKIAAAIGRTIDDSDNIFKSDPYLSRVFLPFAGGYSQYNVNLPHWTIGEFWTQLQNTFGVVIDSGASGAGLRIRSRTNYYESATKITSIDRMLDEYTLTPEDDTESDISVSNVGFADAELSPVDLLDEAVRGSAKIDQSFDSIEAIISHMGTMSAQRQPSGVTIDAILFSDAGMAVIMFFLLITMAPLLFGGSTCMRHASSRSRAMRSTSS